MASWKWALLSVPVLLCSGAALSDLKLLQVVELKGTTHHVQGIETDGNRLWVTSVDSLGRKGFLHEFSFATGEPLRAVEVQNGDQFHAGGLASDGESLWIPVAEYRAKSSSVIQRRSKKSLALEFQFAVPDHIGCVAVTPEFLIGGNWDSRDFYVWNRRGELIRKVPSTTGNSYQDMKFDSKFLIASGGLADKTGAIDWLDATSFQLVRRMAAGKTDKGASFTREGMGVHGDRLLLLPEDGPSRLFVFQLPPM